MDTFRYCTLYRLLLAEDLALVSIWSPTFLPGCWPRWSDGPSRCAAILRRTHAAAADTDTGRGRAATPGPARSASGRVPGRGLAGPAPAGREAGPDLAGLAFLSCWTDAGAARPARASRAVSRRRDPVEGIAGDGGVRHDSPGRRRGPGPRDPFALLRVRGVYGGGGHGTCRLADALEADARYRVVLTTGGGLYRYELRDRCRLRVSSAGARSCDSSARRIASATWRARSWRRPTWLPCSPATSPRRVSSPGLRCWCPSPAGPDYRLYLQSEGLPAALQAEVEEGLRENPTTLMPWAWDNWLPWRSCR